MYLPTYLYPVLVLVHRVIPLLLSLIQPLISQIDLMHFWPGLRPLRPRVQYQWLLQLKLLENSITEKIKNVAIIGRKKE